ncbi:MAG: hypothetical protein O2954_04365, partial [bacterium]|nr:hypothetical protein [bacterium]
STDPSPTPSQKPPMATKPHPSPAPQSSVVTFRAIALGLLLVLGINAWITFSEYIVHASRMQLSFFPVALLAAYLLLILLNGILRRTAPTVALTEAELLTVLAMGFVGTSIPTSGITGFLMGIIASVYYFATPENQWAGYLHPHIPAWAVPSNEHRAMTWFFEGLPAGQHIPYAAWAIPLAWWMLFLIALGAVFFCTAVILRRQWVQHERLLYPLASVGATLAQNSRNRLLPDALHGPLFWGGFAVGFGVISWNILTYFWPLVPEISIRGEWVVFVRNFPRISTRINLLTAGLAYFANLNILFSIWFFFLVFFWLQNGILNRIGYAISAPPNISSSDTEVAAWQGFGALTVLFCWNLWTARTHIKTVFATAFGKTIADDSDELLSYRTAVFGLLAGLLFLTAFFFRLGMQGKLIAFLIPALVINYLTMARIVSETGLAYMRTTLAEQYAALYTIGSRDLSPSSMTGLSLTYGLVSQGKGIFMVPFAHVARLADLIREHRKRLVPALFLVILLGTLADVLLTIWLGYQHGAFNFNVYPFSSAGPLAYNATVSQMRSPFGISWERLAVFGIGAGIMALLTFLHYRTPRWPLHPIGFPIAYSWSTQLAIFSIFLIWAFKAILLRIGGVTLYRKWQPAFLGLLAGYALAVALSFVIDVIWFPGQGHNIHGW